MEPRMGDPVPLRDSPRRTSPSVARSSVFNLPEQQHRLSAPLMLQVSAPAVATSISLRPTLSSQMKAQDNAYRSIIVDEFTGEFIKLLAYFE